MNVKQKEIVLIAYPFSNLEGKKVRPALIVSNNDFNKTSQDCVAVPLTTVLKQEPYSITIETKHLSAGKLVQISRIRTDKIFCIEKKLIRLKIAKLNDVTFNQVLSDIKKIF
jgi:mRNA interferase MazF